MLDTYTVTFTGHRYIDNILQVEMRLEQIIRELIQDHEYVEFLVGRDGGNSTFYVCILISVYFFGSEHYL